MKISVKQKAESRARLLEEAAKQFARNGFDNTNIDSIAIGAGYAKGTIYNYFSNKEELFAKVIEEAASKAVARYHSVEVGKNTRDSLRELAKADVSVLREEEPFMKVLAGEAMNPSSERYNLILSHLGEFIEIISQILEQGVQDGEIRSDMPIKEQSLLFVGLLTLMYIQHWKSGGVWPELDDVPDLVVNIFLDGVRTRGR